MFQLVLMVSNPTASTQSQMTRGAGLATAQREGCLDWKVDPKWDRNRGNSRSQIKSSVFSKLQKEHKFKKGPREWTGKSAKTGLVWSGLVWQWADIIHNLLLRGGITCYLEFLVPNWPKKHHVDANPSIPTLHITTPRWATTSSLLPFGPAWLCRSGHATVQWLDSALAIG